MTKQKVKELADLEVQENKKELKNKKKNDRINLDKKRNIF